MPLGHGRQDLGQGPAHPGILPRQHRPLQGGEFTGQTYGPGLDSDPHSRPYDLQGPVRFAAGGQRGGLPGEVAVAGSEP
ncbi:hypothetical protein ACFWNE_07315 [Streptomyces goshikiensis]|uniref:hypothetical protein n=1 Tax=Streptomyces goshikiensis TaxID=1942 RepID=UPI003656F4EE